MAHKKGSGSTSNKQDSAGKSAVMRHTVRRSPRERSSFVRWVPVFIPVRMLVAGVTLRCSPPLTAM